MNALAQNVTKLSKDYEALKKKCRQLQAEIEALKGLLEAYRDDNRTSESFDRTASHMAGEYVAHPVKAPMMVLDGNRVYPAFKQLTDEEIEEVINRTYWIGTEDEIRFKIAKAILRKAQEK